MTEITQHPADEVAEGCGSGGGRMIGTQFDEELSDDERNLEDPVEETADEYGTDEPPLDVQPPVELDDQNPGFLSP